VGGSDGVGRRRRLLLTGGLGAPVAFALLLVAQAVGATRGTYLPTPDYAVEGLAEPAGGAAADAAVVRLAVLGDSTVAGIGAPRAEESLPFLVAQRVADATGRPVAVRGYGVSGARTAHLVELQAPMLAGDGWDVVVAVIGSNDATHGTSPWAMRRQTRALAEAVEDPLVIGGIPLFGSADALARPLRDLVGVAAHVLRRSQRAAAAEAGVCYVEIARDASPRFAGVPEAMSEDGFHPSPVGYGFWADAIAPAVVQVLAGRT
jgi:lysophospholipase L1-like esterase